MAYAHYNTLEYVKLLAQSGFNQRQAEGLNEAQMIATQAVLSQVATQSDLQVLRTDMQELRIEIKEVEHRLEHKISAIKPFVLKAIISSIFANFAVLGIGIGILAFMFQS